YRSERRIPGWRIWAAALAASAQPRAVRGIGDRRHRNRPQFDPARALVWSAIAGRDGGCVFRRRRPRAAGAAGLAIAPRPPRLGWRLSSLRRGGFAAPAVVVAAAVETIFRRIAGARQGSRRQSERRRLELVAGDPPPRVLGAVRDILLHRDWDVLNLGA